ncbi:glycosyltransferase [Streptococcus suis]|nr:glycosyltransferase [Streptococcus suis]
MTVYIFNLLVGFNFTGVDHAQGKRAQLLTELGIDYQYIFSEMPTRRELEFYSSIGIPEERQVSVYSSFTDNTNTLPTINLTDMEVILKEKLVDYSVTKENNNLIFYKEGYKVIVETSHLYKDKVTQISWFNHNYLLKIEHFSNTLLYTDYYSPIEKEHGLFAEIYKRTFYNLDGSVAFDTIYRLEGEYHIFPSGKILSKAELVNEYIENLNLSSKDLIILDRIVHSSFGQPLLKSTNGAKIIAVLHSEHYFERLVDADYGVGLSHEYYNYFNNLDRIDTFVVSTSEQAEKLHDYIKLHHHRTDIAIKVIPVGYIEKVSPNQKENGKQIVSISRITQRKRIDWLIKAVIEARKTVADISLNIYGAPDYAAYYNYLSDIIHHHQAEDYIQFKGYTSNKEIYKGYDILVNASVGESFGLVFLEAVSFGLPIIGFDVPYGSREFINDDKNGVLVPFSDSDEENIKNLSNSIIHLLTNPEFSSLKEGSYEVANRFLKSNILNEWKELLEVGT